MGKFKNDKDELFIRVRDYLLEIADNNNMKWGEFLKLIYVCVIDISAQCYIYEYELCKEKMRSVLETLLTAGEKIYGTKAKD